MKNLYNFVVILLCLFAFRQVKASNKAIEQEMIFATAQNGKQFSALVNRVKKSPSALLDLAQKEFEDLSIGEKIFLIKSSYGEYTNLNLGKQIGDSNQEYIFEQFCKMDYYFKNKFISIGPAHKIENPDEVGTPGKIGAIDDEECNCCDYNSDPNKADKWDKYRTVRSELIRWMLSNPKAMAFVSERGIDLWYARIEGYLDFGKLVVNIPLSFRRCAFTDGIDLTGGQFRSISFDGCHVYGGIMADYIKVDKYLHFNDFTSIGQVSLYGAQIEGDFYTLGGHFINPEGICIRGDCATIGGNILFQDGFEVQGKVCFVASKINGVFKWYSIDPNSDFTLDIRYAHIDMLNDDTNSWPKKDRLYLDGMVYKGIIADAPIDASGRIKWLERQKAFLPQNYDQLAKCFQNMGLPVEAKKVLIAKEKEITRNRPIGERWLRFVILGVFLGYGYDLWRPVYLGVFIVALGGFLFNCGFRRNLMIPVGESESENVDGHPTFSSLVYSLETFAPLLDLHQKKYWLPDPRKGRSLQEILEPVMSRWKSKRLVQVTNRILRWRLFQLRTGALLRWWFWGEIVLGWTITTLLVVGLTGLVHRL